MSNRISILVLEDGTVFTGTPFGGEVDAEGEVVFNTSMTGYQEVCTDPSYRGQMVVMTHPQIGNYGISRAAYESTRPWVAALIVRDYAPFHNHWQSEASLGDWLANHGVPGLQGVDTRALTRLLRTKGTMRARCYVRESPPDEVEMEGMLESVRQVPSLSEKDLVGEVSGAGEQADVLTGGTRAGGSPRGLAGQRRQAQHRPLSRQQGGAGNGCAARGNRARDHGTEPERRRALQRSRVIRPVSRWSWRPPGSFWMPMFR